MPATLCALFTIRKVQELVLVYLFGLFGADDANLVVAATETSPSVDDGMDMQFRCLRLAGELAQTLHKLLLEVVGDVVLFAEEDYTALRDYHPVRPHLDLKVSSQTHW